jgi:hypothetical protein
MVQLWWHGVGAGSVGYSSNNDVVVVVKIVR